jgi:hypothetical protein
MLRAIGGTVLGCVAAFAIVWAVEMASSTAFPLPEPAKDPAQLGALMDDIPLAAKLAVVGGWWLGTAFGGWIAVSVARARWPALVVGVLMTCAVIFNIVTIPHPLWMQVAGVLGPLAIAGLLWRPRRAG